MSDQAVDAFAFGRHLLERLDPSDRVDDADLDVWNDLVDRAEDVALALEDGALTKLRVGELSTLIAESELSASQTSEGPCTKRFTTHSRCDCPAGRIGASQLQWVNLQIAVGQVPSGDCFPRSA